jgi:hypothetical protein
MLVAEIHGHRVPEAANSEDYLTSAVFGHLRYLSPKVFWNELIKRVWAMPDTASRTLGDDLEKRGIDLTTYDEVSVRFWSTHPLHGCPDLILVFTGRDTNPLVLLIEAKLWSDKSGTGEFDQIARYLRLLDDPGPVLPPLPQKFSSALIYLTEHDCLAQLEDSVEAYGHSGAARRRIFQLQWQDIVDAAQHASRKAAGTEKLILQDVADFLRARNLEYFRGFRTLDMPPIEVRKLHVFARTLFTQVPLPIPFRPEPLIGSEGILGRAFLPNGFKIEKGSWI